ncbi:maleylpyruvate isomerase family mycothiol-dependent enzyme [Streptosporangiaceae bacterium NEAU-GS5]|nr:maleylpyruvate isomerase family mycothiol-dependent enzyme [Streptosporangiaceae bacterium NEAU-GS5]
MLSFDDHCAEIVAQTTAMAKLIEGADLATAVPTCPRWNLDKLTRHVGGAHRWATALVETRAPGFVAPERAVTDDHVAYLRDGADRLVAALRESGPAAPMWTWTDDRTAGYWARRMMNETLVHRADAALALGQEFTAAPELAADAIAEWLDLASVLLAGNQALRGSGQTIGFRTTSGPAGWTVRRGPDGVELLSEPVPADATLTGPATTLLLVLTRRLPSSHVEVSGDAGLAAHWLDNASF